MEFVAYGAAWQTQSQPVNPRDHETTGYARSTQRNVNEKSKVTAGVLGLLLGGLGIHKFYLGYTQQGLILLGGTILSVILMFVVIGIFGILAIGVITFIEGVIYLTQSDEEFYEKYVLNKKAWF